MHPPTPSPVLSLQVDAVQAIDDGDALPGLWILFTKCKESLQEGRRLENISWRLWHRELAARSSSLTSTRSTSSVFSGSSCSSDAPSSGSDTSDDDDCLSEPEHTAWDATTVGSRSGADVRLSVVAPRRNSRGDSSRHTLPPSPASHEPKHHHHHHSPPAKPRNKSFSSQSHSTSDLSDIYIYRRHSLARSNSNSNSSAIGTGPGIGKVISELLPDKLVVLTAKNLSPSERASLCDNSSTLDEHLENPSGNYTHVSITAPSTPPNAPSQGPRVVVVNPTPHPTPPATPQLLSSSDPGTTPHTYLPAHLLPPPVISPSRPKEVPPPSPSPRPAGSPPADSSSSKPDGGIEDGTLKSSQRRFFLQQSPASEGDSASSGSQTRGHPLAKTPTPASPTPAKVPTSKTLSAANAAPPPTDKGDQKESPAQEVVRPVAVSRSISDSTASGRKASLTQAHKARKGRDAGILSRAAHPAVGGARPSMLRSHTQRAHPYHHAAAAATTSHAPRVVHHAKTASTGGKMKTVFKIGSTSSNGSKGVASMTRTKSAGDAAVRAGHGLTALAPAHVVVGSKSKAKAKEKERSASPVKKTTEQQPQQHQRRRIEISNTSSEFETTDMDDSDDESWASEEESSSRSRAQQAPSNKHSQVQPQTQQPRNRKEHKVDNVRIDEAAARAQEHLDLFAKVPRRTYSNLDARSRSGLLSSLFHPPPELFPVGHPYRTSLSSLDILPQHAGQRSVYPGPYAQQQAGPSAPRMMGSKSEASMTGVAAPVVTTTTVGSASTTNTVATASTTRTTRSGSTGYRPKGPPADVVVDDESESEEDPEDRVQLSRSLAQERLAALADPTRRRAAISDKQSQLQHPGIARAHTMYAGESERATLTSVASAPIPLGHPYNLPAPAPPSTPRTTRRQMLSTELSESLRRNLLWERQVSKINMMSGAPRRQVGILGGGVRPLTTRPAPLPGEVQRQKSEGSEDSGAVGRVGGSAGKEKDEKRQRAMARHRSWLDDYHGAGW